MYPYGTLSDSDKLGAYTLAVTGDPLTVLYTLLEETEKNIDRLGDQVEFYRDHQTKRLEIITVEEALRALAREVQDEWRRKIGEYIEQAEEKKLEDPVGALAMLEQWRELPGYEKFEPPRAPGEVLPGLKNRTVRLSDGTELSFRIHPADIQKIETLEKELKERVARREKVHRLLRAAREHGDIQKAWQHFARALQEDPDLVHDEEFENTLRELSDRTRDALHHR